MGSPSDLPDLLDRAVIAWILDGNAEARNELRRRYQARVHDAILRRVRDPQAASDLTDTTFKKAFKNLRRFKLELPFAPWIFTIADNTVNDHFKKAKRETQARYHWLWATTGGRRLREGVPAIDQDPSNPPIDVDRLRREYALARDQVNRTYLKCFELHYVEDRSYAAIARKLHLKEAIARSYASRAKEQLEQMLGELRDYLLTEITPA